MGNPKSLTACTEFIFTQNISNWQLPIRSRMDLQMNSKLFTHRYDVHDIEITKVPSHAHHFFLLVVAKELHSDYSVETGSISSQRNDESAAFMVNRTPQNVTSNFEF